MASYKPLVLVSGQVQQLQTGDTLNAVVSEREVIAATNKNAGSITICQVAYAKTTAGQVDLAKADAAGTTRPLALVSDTTIAADATGNFQSAGLFTATTGQWDAVTGATGGLTPGSIYYLSAATAGQMTTTAPVSGYIVEIGQALSTTELNIKFGPVIKL